MGPCLEVCWVLRQEVCDLFLRLSVGRKCTGRIFRDHIGQLVLILFLSARNFFSMESGHVMRTRRDDHLAAEFRLGHACYCPLELSILWMDHSKPNMLIRKDSFWAYIYQTHSHIHWTIRLANPFWSVFVLIPVSPRDLGWILTCTAPFHKYVWSTLSTSVGAGMLYVWLRLSFRQPLHPHSWSCDNETRFRSAQSAVSLHSGWCFFLSIVQGCQISCFGCRLLL